MVCVSSIPLVALLLIRLSLHGCDAFFVSRPVQHQALKSEPSDTSSDPVALEDENVAVVGGERSEVEAAVSGILDILPSSLGEVDEEERAEINEILFKLETLNPTTNPAMSPLLNGVWELKYAGGYTSEGALASPTSPGLFALALAQKLPSSVISMGELQIAISRDQPRIEARVDVESPLGQAEVLVKAGLEAESGIRLRETYESAEVMGRSVQLPKPFQYSREMYVTYVDDDILLIRDGSGVPELLVRKDKTFSRDWGTEPSEVDDMSAPGEKP